VKPVPAKTGILSHDNYQPGDLVPSDQYVVKTPGRLQKVYGREALNNCYHGGTIFQDAASNLVIKFPLVQVKLLLGKLHLKIGFGIWLACWPNWYFHF